MPPVKRKTIFGNNKMKNIRDCVGIGVTVLTLGGWALYDNVSESNNDRKEVAAVKALMTKKNTPDLDKVGYHVNGFFQRKRKENPVLTISNEENNPIMKIRYDNYEEARNSFKNDLANKQTVAQKALVFGPKP